MIQYQYFNNNRGGEDRLSVSMEAPEYAYLEGLFRRMRSIAEGTGFTYATLSSGKAIFMQTTGGDSVQFAKGLLVDRMNEFPCKFIGKFEKEMDNLDSIGHKLPDGELPAISRRAPEFPSNRSFHRMVPRIIDALVCQDLSKKILVITGSQDESEKVMCAISSVLPKKMMSGIGFSIGAKSVDSSDISIKNPNGKPDTASIRIWLPDLADYKMGNYSSDYYVFDLTNEVDNYGERAGILAKVLEEMDLCDVSEVRDFISFVEDAFADNGSVNKDELESLCTEFLLQMKKDPEVAKMLLDSRDPSNPKDKLSLISAISVITDPDNARKMRADDLDLILGICKANAEIRKAVSGGVIEFISNSRGFYEELSAESKSVCASMIADDESGEAFSSLCNNWWMTCRNTKEKDAVATAVFTLTCDAIKTVFKEKRVASTYAARHIIDKAVRFFNADISRDIDLSELFSVALGQKDKNVREFSICVLLASAHLPGVNNTYVTSVIEKLAGGIAKFPAKEQMEMIFDLRGTLIQISEECRDLKLEKCNNFPFTCEKGKELCNKIIGVTGGANNPIKNSIRDLIDVYMDALGSGYEGMIAVAEKFLCDAKYVESSLEGKGDKVINAYERCLDRFSKAANIDELRRIVRESKGGRVVDDETKDAIFENMKEKFGFFSKEDQNKILSKLDLSDDLDSFSVDQKRKFSEELSQYPHLERAGKLATSIVIDSSFILTAVFPIISALLLILPALLMVAFSTVDVTLAERINGYLNGLLLIAIPIAELVVLALMYHFTKNAGKQLSRTVKIGVLYNIPIVIYDIIILILFYTGYSINGLF